MEFFHLLCWQRIPSGKQSFPVPLFLSLPQSDGNMESLPVAWGLCVPSSRNLPPPNICLKKPWNGLVMGRKKFSKALKNWASVPPTKRRATTKHTVNSFMFSVFVYYIVIIRDCLFARSLLFFTLAFGFQPSRVSLFLVQLSKMFIHICLLLFVSMN